jgi:hypothetical protein
VSKRHQSSRRRTYGRRQHEIHERESRRHHPTAMEFDGDSFEPTSSTDPLAFLDPRAPRLRYLMGE